MNRKAYSLLLLISFALINGLLAQPFDWAQSLGSSSLSQVYEIETDNNGNSYIAGRLLGTTTLGNNTITVSGTNTVLLAKLDAAGNYLWSTVIEGSITVSDITINPSGDLYVAGVIYNTPLMFDTVNVNSGYPTKHYMAKYDANGDFQWIDLIDGGINTTVETGSVVTADANGNVDISLVYKGTISTGGNSYTSSQMGASQSMWQAQYDGNGNINWTNQADLLVPQWGYITVDDSDTDGSGAVYITGNFNGAQIVAGTDTFSTTGLDSAYYFILKYDNSGNFAWGDVATGTGYQAPSAGVGVSASGDVYVGGVFSNSATFGSTTLNTGSSNNAQDYFLLKYDPQGNILWAKQSGNTGGTTPQQLISNVNDEVYLIGHYKHPLTIGGTILSNPTLNTTNIFIIKYDAAGNPMWAQEAGESTSSYNSYGFDLSNDDSGNLYLAAYSGNNSAFGALNLQTVNLADRGVIARLSDTTFVLPFPTDSIWPGDANYDLIADNNDLLALGIGYGSTGTVRANASNNWVGQPGYDWGQTLASGVDYKHLDCNGDGIINDQDTLAISQNYGLTHNKTDLTDDMGPLLYTEFLTDSAFVGDTVEVAVNFGTDTLPANMVYGLAFTINVDTSLVDPNSLQVSYDSSWLGDNGIDMLTLHKNFPVDGVLDMALTRTDQNNITGFGEIARISIIMIDDITAKNFFTEMLNVSISNQYVIDASEIPVPVSLASDSLILLQEDTTGNNTAIAPNLDQYINVYPNPANGQLSIEMTDLRANGYELRDNLGRLIVAKKETFTRKNISLGNLADGVYFFIVDTDKGRINKKILVRN